MCVWMCFEEEEGFEIFHVLNLSELRLEGYLV